jgi:hypothetical protein
MKKFLLGSAAALLSATLFAQPQHRPDGPPKPPPVATQWKNDSIKLQLYVVLATGQMADVKTAFVSFYKDMDALLQQAGGSRPEREEMEKVSTKRKAALKAILTSQQLDRFDAFEKEFIPPPHPPKPNNSEEKV